MPPKPVIKQYSLTERELQVLRLAAKGNSNKEIATVLEISAETVKKHLKNIYTKLNVRNKIEAINRVNI